MKSVPKDPFILLSFVNMHLRDDGETLDELCKKFDIDENELKDKLSKAGFKYSEENNQFR